MYGYTDKIAKALATQIKTRFGLRIDAACDGSFVPPEFLACLIAVEAAKDRNGQIVFDSVRFEKGVYADLVSLRDNGFCYVWGKKKTHYSGVQREQIKDADNAALKNLSRSFGPTQIMGWHVINDLKCTIAELRSQEKHFALAVELLDVVADDFVMRRDWASVLRIWNTGSPNGKTHHDDYVDAALCVMRFYKTVEVKYDTEVFDESGNDGVDDLRSNSNGEENQAAQESRAQQPIGDAPDAPATQVGPKGLKRWFGELTGTLLAGGAGVWAFLKSEKGMLLLAFVFGMTTILAVVFRNTIDEVVRKLIASDPNRKNVK